MTQSGRSILGAPIVRIAKIEEISRRWRGVVLDGAFTRYWFFSHFLFILTIAVPAEIRVAISVFFFASFGLFLAYLSSTLLLSGITSILRKRFLEGVWSLLWVFGLLYAAISCIPLILDLQKTA
jgi:hypothetical protein